MVGVREGTADSLAKPAKPRQGSARVAVSNKQMNRRRRFLAGAISRFPDPYYYRG